MKPRTVKIGPYFQKVIELAQDNLHKLDSGDIDFIANIEDEEYITEGQSIYLNDISKKLTK